MIPDKVKITKFGNRVGISDDEGPFLDENDNARIWKTESSALAFLRRSKLKWHVTKLNGKIAYINCLNPIAEAERETWPPHEWVKNNAVTITDRTGSYDVARCRHCGIQEKRYGLQRWTTSGHCPKRKATGA